MPATPKHPIIEIITPFQSGTPIRSPTKKPNVIAANVAIV